MKKDKRSKDFAFTSEMLTFALSEASGLGPEKAFNWFEKKGLLKNIPKYSEPGTVPFGILKRMTNPDHHEALASMMLKMLHSDEDIETLLEFVMDPVTQKEWDERFGEKLPFTEFFNGLLKTEKLRCRFVRSFMAYTDQVSLGDSASFVSDMIWTGRPANDLERTLFNAIFGHPDISAVDAHQICWTGFEFFRSRESYRDAMNCLHPDNQLKMLEIFLDDMTLSEENAGEFAHLCLDIAYQNAKTSLVGYKKFRSLAEKIGDLTGRDLVGEFPWEDPDQLSLALHL